MKDTHIKSIIKSIVWRLIGVCWLAVITWIYTHSYVQTSLITFIHHGIFLIVFYLHERLWLEINILKNIKNKLKYGLKAITYEIILGNLILGLITYFVTDDVKIMTGITLTYIFSKLVLYYFYDWIWSKRKKIVYAYLVADILHIGHLRFLKKAKEYGDKLIVGILTNNATTEKKSDPIIPFDERIEIIRSISFVDKAIIQDTYSPLENVKKIKPDVLIESDSHKEMPANDFVKSYGGEIKILPYYQGQSSTKIKKKIIDAYWYDETKN